MVFAVCFGVAGDAYVGEVDSGNLGTDDMNTNIRGAS